MIKKVVLVLVLMLSVTSCKDRYRYTCQDPDNFGKEECQKPKCQFTQTCPDYLVAPILERSNAKPTDSTKSTVDR